MTFCAAAEAAAVAVVLRELADVLRSLAPTALAPTIVLRSLHGLAPNALLHANARQGSAALLGRRPAYLHESAVG